MNRAQTEDSDFSKPTGICSRAIFFMTVTDTNYTMVKTNQTEVDIPHGLVLDVFPLDVCPDSRFARKMQYVWTMLYSLFLAQVVPEKHGGIVGGRQ